MVIRAPVGDSYITFGQYWNIFVGTYTVHIANVRAILCWRCQHRCSYDLHLSLSTSFSVQIAVNYQQSVATRYSKFRNTM